MAASWSGGGRPRGAGEPSGARRSGATERGATRADSRAAGTRGGSLRLSRGCVDSEPSRRGDRANVWRALFARSCQPAVAPTWLEPTAADHAGDAARRASDSAMAGGALAGAQKRADDEGATIVWVDESGFYLLPLAVRTWAPRGHTPILRVPLTRDHLSVISAITLDGRLFLQVRKDSYDGEAVVGFLRVLLRKIAGKVLLIWDGSPIHHGQAVKDFLRAGAAKRLQLEQLPGYAPDLNPDEGIWNYVKRVELGNVCCANLGALRHHLLRAGVRVRHNPAVIRACSRQCGYLL
jgi:transposase